ncbi:MAG: BatA domain-containing protein [Deltaproteobacteria bacterium]|nr:BatA domain-containing protein [Deltaproteobacteria bacterium]
MEFLAPLMLVGAIGAAVPIVIHLIGRRRAPVRKFGAIDFLLGTNRRVARRLRLREIVLLCLRVAACLAIPLALAKPLISVRARGPVIQRGPQAVVLVIDNSFSMGTRRGDETYLDIAKDKAKRALSALGPEADVGVVLTAEGSVPPNELTRDHLRLRSQIADAQLSMRPAGTRRALRSAHALLSGTPHAAKRVYLFSPLMETSFPPGDPPWPEGSGPELHLVDVTEGEPTANLAVVGLRVDQDTDVGSRGLQVIAEIANYGSAVAKDRVVTLRIGSRSVARGLVTVGSSQSITKRFTATLASDTRVADVVVELDGDMLPFDDRRYLRVELRRDVRALVVDGDPRTVRHEDEAFYLETALRPGDRADSALLVTKTTTDELPRLQLSDYDVLFLCNVKPLDAARVAEIEAWLEKGGGLLVSVGDNVEADAYNATMAPILAQELRSLRDVAPGASPGEQEGRAERIGRLETGHPIFGVFSANAEELRGARFRRLFLVGPTSRGEQRRSVPSLLPADDNRRSVPSLLPADEHRRSVARFESGAPFLVEARVGAGRVLLMTSTIDRDWNDLPIHPGYLPLIQQVARYLARSPTRDPGGDLLVGRVREIPVAAADDRIEVTSPRGKKTIIEKKRIQGRTSVAFTDTSEPGVYRVATASAEGGLRQRQHMSFAVNLDPRGSDTRRVAADRIPVSAGSGNSGKSAGETAAAKKIELWHGLAASLLLFLFSEAVLTSGLGHVGSTGGRLADRVRR